MGREMSDTIAAKESLLKRRATRRTVLSGALAAGSVAVAYAALGDQLGIYSGGSSDPVDADAIAKESVQISHLLRRAGFGASSEEYERYQSMGLQATIDELVNYTAVDDSAALALAAEVPTETAQRGNPALWWVVRMANTKRPLQEKMTLFWHGLITSQLSVVNDNNAMVQQNEFMRAHALGSFPEMLRGISMDRAMMEYLDIAGSVRRAPNENYARELMELFAMGEGNYTEDDVREAARAFTGWVVQREYTPPNIFTLSEPVFRPERFDNGQKTFLGKTGNFRPDDIVDIIAAQPATARHITRKLFEFFVYSDPEDGTLEPFVKVYNDNDGNIGAVVSALLHSEVFYSPRAYRALVKTPLEYVVGAVKALGMQANITPLLAPGNPPRALGLITNMGQTPFEPPNVAGWPGGAAWLNATTMFARLNFINQATGGAPLPRGADRFIRPATTTDLGTAKQALEYYLPLALDDNMPAASRQVFIDFAGGEQTELSPEALRGLAYLIFASPQFHLS
jgi:uncharacterized protein (DUF1800 family)